LCDEAGRIVEQLDQDLVRMRPLLPSWPAEVLKEWLYEHYNQLGDYAYLDFEALHFSRESWALDRIPGREAFRDAGFLDAFQDVEERAKEEYDDWLPQHMMASGTWHTPPIILENLDGAATAPDGERLGWPYHLLEGHRRLSFLHGLRRLGRALPQHDFWVVRRASG
jgi:hypothetical protein